MKHLEKSEQAIINFMDEVMKYSIEVCIDEKKLNAELKKYKMLPLLEKRFQENIKKYGSYEDYINAQLFGVWEDK